MSDLGAGGDTSEPDPSVGTHLEEAAEPTRGGEPAPADLAPTALETLALSPEEWRIVAVAGVDMDLPSANPEIRRLRRGK